MGKCLAYFKAGKILFLSIPREVKLDLINYDLKSEITKH